MKDFSKGDRVQVSSDGGWKNTFLGTICSDPEPVDTIKGPEYFYWVEFDDAQEDINGPDLYRKAQILSCYIDSV